MNRRVAAGRAEHALLAFPRRDIAVTAVVVALTAAVFAAVSAHGALARIQSIDNTWLQLMITSRSAPVTAMATFLNVLGLVYVTLPVRIAIVGFLALRRRWWHLAAFVAAIVMSEIFIGTLKDVYGRPRPPGSLVSTSGASFPSGHAIAASATVVAAVIALVPAGRRRAAWGTVAVAFSILMALSRAYLGAHWLSDALAGVLLGTSCALLASVVVGALQRRAPARRLLGSSRYRHPGDVIRLISAAVVLAGALAASAVASRWLLGPDAPFVTGLGSDPASRLLTGIVQVACVAAPALVVAATLRRRRFRLLGALVIGAVVAGAAAVGLFYLVGDRRPEALTAHLARSSWLASSAFPGPALVAAAVAVIVAASPWLSRPWRRTAWVTLLVAVAARVLTGMVLPMELVIAIATGATVGAAVLLAFGVPDRRTGPDEIAESLRCAGVPVASVSPADVEAKGSRPFTAVTADGRRLFIKVLGSDQRDADLLYRAYRAARLRNVGDTRPAASLFQAVEHQALVGVMAERAGVHVPSVDRVIKVGDGSGLLVMEWVDGCSLEQLSPDQITDDLLMRLWTEVDKLHRARIAHRSLRAANVMVNSSGRPRIVDFSFAELDATERQMDLDVAELLASLAALAGEDRAVSSATEVLGAQGVAPSVPLLQPLALSAATRRAVSGHDGLLARTRSQAAAASGRSAEERVRVQRVRPRTLLAIAAATGAFYLILPQLAQVESSWRTLQTAHWTWLPLVIAFSLLTYLAGALSLLGSVSLRLPFWPTVLTQGASSFINRVSPSNVGGMALNVRYLQKTGVDTPAGVAAIGVNALAGTLVHLVLLVIFFAWAGRGLSRAFKLPSSSKLLLILAVVAAAVGVVMATRQGRRFAARKLLPGLRSSLANLRQVAQSPVKLALLFGGSALVTLAYIGGLAASMEAFGAGASIAEVGAVYLGASIIAAASPTPGGLGALEAALIAGLTGIGISSGAAVSTVLTYRLATYWLPVVPGWFSFRALQRRDYV
jgi:undecaprenyl-diphosphatase